MADEFIRQESFHLSNVALVPGILEKATDGGFVGVFRHNLLISVPTLGPLCPGCADAEVVRLFHRTSVRLARLAAPGASLIGEVMRTGWVCRGCVLVPSDRRCSTPTVQSK
jgi:hypothetical protein